MMLERPIAPAKETLRLGLEKEMTYVELLSQLKSFANSLGQSVDKVTLSVDEHWNGYEDCEVSFEALCPESDDSFAARVKLYEQELKGFEVESEAKWQKFKAAREAADEVNRIKRLGEIDSVVQGLLDEKQELKDKLKGE